MELLLLKLEDNCSTLFDISFVTLLLFLLSVILQFARLLTMATLLHSGMNTARSMPNQ